MSDNEGAVDLLALNLQDVPEFTALPADATPDIKSIEPNARVSNWNPDHRPEFLQ